MLVDPKRTVTSPATAAVRRATSGAVFTPASGEPSATARATHSAGTAATGSLDALIALQVGEDPRERRRRSVQHGRDLLDDLDRLKAALLTGRVPAADLAAVARRLKSRPDLSGDPRLDEIVGQIDLRAQVELAKLAGRRMP